MGLTPPQGERLVSYLQDAKTAKLLLDAGVLVDTVYSFKTDVLQDWRRFFGAKGPDVAQLRMALQSINRAFLPNRNDPLFLNLNPQIVFFSRAT